MNGVDEKSVQNFVDQPGEESPLGRCKVRWEKNIKMYLVLSGSE
jgi:hypothetical protein